eukprot:jgi/Ulvmu1/6205/UM028_0061.1
MDCVNALLRADVESLSEHADALAALQRVMLSARSDFSWLATDEAADGFVHAAKTLVSFLRQQALSLMSDASASEQRAARAAIMQAGVSMLAAVAGHPSARQWLHAMPEARQLACALQNLPPHMSEHAPLIEGGRAMQRTFFDVIGQPSRSCSESDAEESDHIFPHAQLPASTSSDQKAPAQSRAQGLFGRARDRAEIIAMSSSGHTAVGGDHQSAINEASTDFQCVPWNDSGDGCTIQPVCMSPPQATVVIEPFLEMYRRSRHAALTSETEQTSLPLPCAARSHQPVQSTWIVPSGSSAVHCKYGSHGSHRQNSHAPSILGNGNAVGEDLPQAGDTCEPSSVAASHRRDVFASSSEV